MSAPHEARIAAAFANVPPPPAWCLASSREGDEPALLERDFRDKRDWRLLTPEFLDWAPDGFASALSFFSDEAFRFYLPAYLIADLNGRLQRADVLFHLTHGLDEVSRNQLINPVRYGSRTWFDAARYKFAMFDEAQAAVIVSYLEDRVAHADTDVERVSARQALDGYWRRRAVPRTSLDGP